MLDYALAPQEGKGTGEQALLRQLLSRIPKVISFLAMLTLKTISFWFFCNWQGLMWFLIEKHGARPIDFRQSSKRLGKKDGLFVLKRPARTDWLNRTFYEQDTPEELAVRAIKTEKRSIVKTLVDQTRSTRAEISTLYRKRWHVELDFRSIRTRMKMEVLHCKSPDMVCEEISVHLLAHNLLRALMARTAQMTGQTPREISLRTAQKTLRDVHMILLEC